MKKITRRPVCASAKLFAAALACTFLLSACAQANVAKNTEISTGTHVSEETFAPPSGNPVLDQMAMSHSASRFTEEAVTLSDIETILRSGAKAPSAKNAQPWHFTVITGADAARAFYENAPPGAVLVVVSGKDDIVTDTVEFDCGLATAYMQLAAESLGYGARILISPVAELEQKREQYGIPEGYTVLAAIVIACVETDAVTSATSRNPLADMVNYVE